MRQVEEQQSRRCPSRSGLPQSRSVRTKCAARLCFGGRRTASAPRVHCLRAKQHCPLSLSVDNHRRFAADEDEDDDDDDHDRDRDRDDNNPCLLRNNSRLCSNDSNDAPPDCQFRKMRNLSEKKRRDQFNLLINELCSMVSTSSRKMDKSSVLKSTIAFLRNHNDQETEIALATDQNQQAHQEDWKPPFLSNEEFAHLMLEALDGFLIAFATNGRITYVSESIASLLGYLPNEVLNMSIYDLVHEDSRSELYEVLNSHSTSVLLDDATSDSQISFVHYMKRGPLYVDTESSMHARHQPTHELVRFVGSYCPWNCGQSDVDERANRSGSGDRRVIGSSRTGGGGGGGANYDCQCTDGYGGTGGRNVQIQTDVTSYNSTDYDDRNRMQSNGGDMFVATVTLQSPQLLREMTLCDDDVARSEFTSRHSLEWKFLFLDHRAPPIIGYLPFEVLGTSGYDYYHVDDLERIVTCHEALMQTGEGTCSYYRFLTKGQQWLWLRTRFYITYHQWNSKPEFIVCTHMVVSCAEARSHLRKEATKLYQMTSNPTQPSGRGRVHENAPALPANSRSQPITGETRALMHSGQEPNAGEVCAQKNTGLNLSGAESLVSGGVATTTMQSANIADTSGLACPSRHEHTLEPGCELHTPFGKSHEATAMTLSSSTSSSLMAGQVVHGQGQFDIDQQSTESLIRHECQFTTSSMPTRMVANDVIAGNASVLPVVRHNDQLQEELRCKHQILQEQIMQQQEELQRIHEQLMFAQFAPQTSATTSANTIHMQYEASGIQQMDAILSTSVSSLENQQSIQYQFPQQQQQQQQQQQGHGGTTRGHMVEYRDTQSDNQSDKRL